MAGAGDQERAGRSKRKEEMKILRIDLHKLKENKPVKSAKPRKVYAKNPKKTFDDPVFKASEVNFYAPNYDESRSVISLTKENGKILREGYIEGVRYLELDGRELVEFTCSPTIDSVSAKLFRVFVEAECIERLMQKRTVK